MNNKKKILLLGGEGFIGRNLAEGLAGRCECFSVGKEKSVFEGNRKDAFLEANPYKDKIAGSWDVLIHLIDNKADTLSFEEEESKLANNLELESGSHVIVFSSAVVYANPDSDYAKRKKMLEGFYGDYCQRHGVAFTALRLFNVYGRYQMPMKPGSLVANIFWNYLNNETIEINDRGAKRDFIYAEDVAPVVENVINEKLEGTLDLGTGKLTSIGNLLKILEEKIFHDKIRVIEKEIKDSAICVSAKTKILREIKLTTLEKGLAETAGFYQKNLNLIKKALAK